MFVGNSNSGRQSLGVSTRERPLGPCDKMRGGDIPYDMYRANSVGYGGVIRQFFCYSSEHERLRFVPLKVQGGIL